MEDWTTLRNRDYDADAAWTCFQDWTNAKPRTTQARLRELECDFLKSVMPLVGSVMRSRFAKMQSADRDDACSEVSMTLLRKVKRHAKRFQETNEPSAFTALMVVTIRNLLYDYLRCNGRDVRDVPPELFYQRPQLSVPKAVELRVILAELPDQIAAFALERDRLGFGKTPILAVARLMVVGKDVPQDMLRNWLGVEHPERCISFVTLMARWYLHRYRERFTPVLDGELAKQVASVDQHCHVL